MAHYAELDENNIVLRVIPGVKEDFIDENGDNGEQIYQKVSGKVWKRTSYNTLGNVHYNPLTLTPDDKPAFRKNYAGIGFYYDEANDAFIPPKPFNSWTLNQDTFMWDPPTPYPNDGNDYTWDEDNLTWKITRYLGTIPPKPYESWTFDEVSAEWKAPVEQPSLYHVWSEESQSWYMPETMPPIT